MLNAIARIARLAATHPRRVLATVAGVLTGPDGECPCCAYRGAFLPCDLIPAWQCPRCLSLHRHRLLALAVRRGFIGFHGLRVLHFAPEGAVSRLIREQGPAAYATADLEAGRADRVLDLEAIDVPDVSVDTVVASHVLEHVDDRKALPEISRILVPGGRLVAMVPIVEGWDETYEDAGVRGPAAQAAHFGRPGHLRYYGRDFRARVEAAGFSLAEFTAGGADSVRYRLKRGCKVFLATRA